MEGQAFREREQRVQRVLGKQQVLFAEQESHVAGTGGVWSGVGRVSAARSCSLRV